jgi:hypothetical protein
MKEEEINRALWEYYKVISEQAGIVGGQKVRLFISTIMCLALFSTYTGLIVTLKDKIFFSFNLVTMGIVVFGIILFLFFISLLGYYLFLRIHSYNLFDIGKRIEQLQRDILFDKIETQEDLEKKFEKIYPCLNAWNYKIKLKNLFYSKRE